MSMLKDAIKKELKGIKIGSSLADKLVIEQTLNKLFYLPAKPKEELEMIKAQYKQKQGDRYGLHASAMLASTNEFCYREQVLSLFFKQSQGENISIGLKRIFEEGNFIGEKWQRLFIRGGLGTPLDMDHSLFKDEYDLSYTPDAIITIGKKKFIVEIKSQNTFTYKKSETHPSGMKQLKFYMYLTGIHNGFVLVEDKNDQNYKVLLADYDAAEMEEYIERLENIQIYKRKFRKLKKPPMRICKIPSCKRALKCNMLDACFNIGEGRVRLTKDV